MDTGLQRIIVKWRLIVLVWVLTACGYQQAVNSNIYDDESKLLRLLIQEDDFAIPVTWEVERIRQNYVSPSSVNDYLIESASRGFIGHTENGQSIIVNHKLERFNVAFDLDKVVDINEPAEGKILDVTLPVDEETSIYQCYSDSLTINCIIFTQHNTILSLLSFILPVEFLENDKVSFIESVLIQTENRIENYE
jgi:hypothetical protein